MNNQIYLHGIYAKSEIYNSKMTLKILKEILEADALLSARLQKMDSYPTYFNGMDYISLCDYEKRNILSSDGFNSYEEYIRYSLALIFPKNKLKVIVPKIINIEYNKDYFRKMQILGMSDDERFSDLPDEVQVKDRVSLDYLIGMFLPICRFYTFFLTESKMTDNILQEIEKIKKLLNEYNRDVPIYDTDTCESLENIENVKLLVKECQKYKRYR